MKKQYSGKQIFMMTMLVIGGLSYFMIFCGIIDDHMSKCTVKGCDRLHAEGSKYCYHHMPREEYEQIRNARSRGTSGSTTTHHPSTSRTEERTTSTSSGHTSGRTNYSYSTTSTRYYDFYDDGYDDVYMDDDYDDYRYEHDDDYRDGVDDAIDEMGDDW